jgi:hypothetical protein
MELQTLDGRTLTGPVTELSDSRATVESEGKPLAVGIERAIGAAMKDGAKPAQESKVWIELIDGSTLTGLAYAVRSGKAEVATAGGKVEIATRDIATVRLQALEEGIKDQWARVLAAKRSGDLLVTRKADAIDYHEGALKNVTDDVVEFDLDGELVPVKRTKAFGLVYHHRAERQLPAGICIITDITGAKWTAQSFELAGDKLKWTTPAGVEVTRAATEVQVDFCHFLSDLKPESVKWTPYIGAEKDVPSAVQFFAPRQDRNQDGKQLQLQGKPYAKGLWMHTRTEMVYRLPGKFSRLKAVAGIDDGVRPKGHVRLVIRGDDKVLMEEQITGNDPPKNVDVDITGVRRLTIFADWGGALDVSDHLDLCNARIIK